MAGESAVSCKSGPRDDEGPFAEYLGEREVGRDALRHAEQVMRVVMVADVLLGRHAQGFRAH